MSTATTGPNPVVAFIIGLAIILLSSILNAAGLNLTKLDHVRTSAIPKAARRKDYMRPLWLLGMVLYILSQLIGSTLALEYMRAEYVAPLGSSSLIFNFLFARFLIGTPVTKFDIYGTIVVILGVVGIVAFGSINSGLATETDVAHITSLWRRGGWLGFFFVMSFVLFGLLIFCYQLDTVLTSRSDLSTAPFSAARQTNGPLPPPNAHSASRNSGVATSIKSTASRVAVGWVRMIIWVTDRLEVWAAPKDDKQVAWTLGIGWACCGGGLAGLCLVFAKAVVKLLSGSLRHTNPGNQFGHVAPIFTIILLAITAVFQIICLNRGLKVYDSTLVVPVFYGVYTATGFLDSLIFNNEVQSYKSWTLFLIFVSMFILISGVVLLTHQKPEPVTNKVRSTRAKRQDRPRTRSSDIETPEPDDDQPAGEGDVLWSVGNASDEEDNLDDGDDDVDHHQHPLHQTNASGKRPGPSGGQQRRGSATRVSVREEDELIAGEAGISRRSMDPFRDPEEVTLEELSRRSPVLSSKSIRR